MRMRRTSKRRNGLLALLAGAGMAFGLADVALAQAGDPPEYEYDVDTLWETYKQAIDLNEELVDVEELVQERERFEDLYRSGELMRIVGHLLGDPVAPANPGPGTAIEEGGLEEGTFVIGPFAEPVSLSVLINFISVQTGEQILFTDPEINSREIVLNQKVEVESELVMEFLGQLLEQQGFSLAPDPTFDRYTVMALADQKRILDQNVRVMSTGPLTPSVVKGYADNILLQGAGRAQNTIVAIDELGILMVTASRIEAAQVERLIERLSEEWEAQEYIEFEVRHIAASVARDRIIEQLAIGASSGRTPRSAPAGEAERIVAAGAGGGLPNLERRLSVAAQSNSLVFRGRPSEAVLLEKVLALCDVPNRLKAEWYPIGPQAEAVAEAGRGEGLGEVEVFSGASAGGTPRSSRPSSVIAGLTETGSGPGFTIYPESGGFIYRGTPEQHTRVDELIERLGELARGADPVYEFYKVEHSTAADIASLLQDLISGQVSGATSDLIDGGLNRRQPTRTADAPPAADATPSGSGELGAIELTDDISVHADEANNQIVIKAPARLQPQFERVIRKLDLRRPQVYLDVKIVTLTTDEDFRFTVESQLISGQFGINTNYGLSGAGTDFLTPRNVSTSLSGLTASLVKSDYVPFIINTLQSNTDTRVVAEPRILVNDNETAEITSVDEEPTTTTSQGNATTERTFSGFVEAGPELSVTPQISEGGYVSLSYDVSISSFQGDSTEPGIPPARRTDSISSNVQIPSDSTIIVGGLTFTTDSDTIVKIPFLGDIPLAGALFRDTRNSNSKNLLYVFITPRIMRDETFDDLRIFTAPALATAEYDPDYPAPEPVSMGLAAAQSVPAGPVPGLRLPVPAIESETEPVTPDASGE